MAGIRVGISGHQSRQGVDWEWTAAEIHNILIDRMPIARAFSSLALGSDQVFAREALQMFVPVTAVVPMSDYERCFKPEDRANYYELLSQCQPLQLDGGGSDEEAFFNAGRWIADNCDLLVAVWDGKPAVGLGGTADVVHYSLSNDRMVIHINPITRDVHTLSSNQF